MDVGDLIKMIVTLPAGDKAHILAALNVDAAGGTDAMDVLALPMLRNDAGAATIRDYLKALVREVWVEQEGFSGKRPFGNSGWSGELEMALVKAGRIAGSLSPEGWLDESDPEAAHKIILEAINRL